MHKRRSQSRMHLILPKPLAPFYNQLLLEKVRIFIPSDLTVETQGRINN